MTNKARGPRTLKGAFVTIDPANPAPNVIAFRYNPSSLHRTLKPMQVGGEEGDRSEAVRFNGPPAQTINIEIELDATDAMASGDATAIALGAMPELAQLELLVYPTLDQVNRVQSQLANGVMEITPMAAPRTLFVWGAKRVLPVRIDSFDITEELFDSQLNPIRATVGVTMRVLTYSDLSSGNQEFYEFMSYQRNLTNIAGRTPAVTPLLGVDVKRL